MTGWHARVGTCVIGVPPSSFYLYSRGGDTMPIRDFTDATGVSWQVWATTPMRGDVRPQFASGWLAFESEAERRRLAPIPRAWEEVGDGELCEFLAQATAVTRGAGAALKRIDSGGGDGALSTAAPALVATVEKVRAVMREVDETLHPEPTVEPQPG
jgi:hypothetical protein